jgi:predicted phage-related endonuclease
MSDFDPAIRNAAWWSGDSRLVANGRGFEAVAIKIGKMEREDISHLENVKMGHVMQPVIARLWEDKHKQRLKDFDIAGTHPKEPWLRSHFDYITEDNKTLVECKNYALANVSKYSEEGDPVRIPDADMIQCVHEATVAGVDTVYLAVLFGGQYFRTFRIDVTDDMKEDLIKRMAVYWAHVKHGTVPMPETPAQARIAWPKDEGDFKQADAMMEKACADLKVIKQEISKLEAREEQITAYLQRSMENYSEMRSIDGTTLATWKAAKASKRFNAGLFQQAMPDIYSQFVVETPGSRRFLVK